MLGKGVAVMDKKILVVDDEIMIREVIKEYCLEEGFSVDEASNGYDAFIRSRSAFSAPPFVYGPK